MKYSILIIGVSCLFLIFVVGCEDKKSKNNQIQTATTTNTPKKEQNSFVIKDIDGRKTVVRIDEGILSVKRVIQPIVIFYIFTPWCAPCKGVLPYLSMLQRKESRRVFIIGLVAGKSMSDSSLREFMKQYDATFFISNSSDNNKLINKIVKSCSLSSNYPLPLTVIYNKGNRVMEIEGAIPYEMLDKIIQDIKKEERY